MFSGSQMIGYIILLPSEVLLWLVRKILFPGGVILCNQSEYQKIQEMVSFWWTSMVSSINFVSKRVNLVCKSRQYQDIRGLLQISKIYFSVCPHSATVLVYLPLLHEIFSSVSPLSHRTTILRHGTKICMGRATRGPGRIKKVGNCSGRAWGATD